MLLDTILLIFLSISIYTDIKYRKIYNFITFPAVILGLGFNFFYSGLPGLKDSLAGFAAGFLFLFIFYLLGGIGAGDVKFMAAVGSLKGFEFVVRGGFYGAILGGIVAIIVLFFRKNFLGTLKKLFYALISLVTFRTPESLKFDESQSVYLPYTVFLALGMFLRWIITTECR
ncbi:MAG: A24 family peptidase [Elusimicrobiota bacterium]